MISNLQIPIYSLLSLLVSHGNKMLAVWLAVNSMIPKQILLFLFFLFYVKKYFHIKKRRRQKLMTQLINQILFSSEMRKYARFAKKNMILMTITKAQLLSFVDSWNMRYPSSKFCNSYPCFYLLKNFTLIKDIINPYNCLSKNGNFSIKTSNEQTASYIIK